MRSTMNQQTDDNALDDESTKGRQQTDDNALDDESITNMSKLMYGTYGHYGD